MFALAVVAAGALGGCASTRSQGGSDTQAPGDGTGVLTAQVLDRRGAPYAVAFVLAPTDAVEATGRVNEFVVRDDTEAVAGESDATGEFRAEIAPGVWTGVTPDLDDQATEVREHCYRVGGAYVPWGGEDTETWEVECDSLD